MNVGRLWELNVKSMTTKCDNCEEAKKTENSTSVILNQESLMMRNKICQTLTKRIKSYQESLLLSRKVICVSDSVWERKKYLINKF